MISEPPNKIPDVVLDSRLLNINQLMVMMGVSKSTVFRLIRNKKDPLPSIKFMKDLRFPLDKVLWWIEKHEQ